MSVSALRDAGFASQISLSALQQFVNNSHRAEELVQPACLPFAYANALAKNIEVSAEEMQAIVVERMATGSYLLMRNFPATVFGRLPLAPHAVRMPDEAMVSAIRRAFDFLQAHYLEGHKFVGEYLRLLVLVGIDTDAQAGSQTTLTSCSLPALPFCSFISEKSLVHLPPLHVAAKHDAAILAENLFHEALHNALNLDILARRVFVPEFRAQTSPHVLIPWRAGAADARDRNWPVDRVLHALFVYVGVAGMRRQLLLSHGLDTAQREFIAGTLPSAAYALRHLSAALQKAKDGFSNQGLASVCKLCDAALSAAAQLESNA